MGHSPTHTELVRTITSVLRTQYNTGLADLEAYDVDGVTLIDVHTADGHSYRITVEECDER